VSNYKGLSLEGQRALVFGGTSGLGHSIAIGFAQAGADVVAVSRRGGEGHVMKEQGKGRIINIASLGGLVGNYEATAYCASKGGVVMLTRCLAAEWAAYNITVNRMTFE
jgi:NAD(P)-dependent dehydrogenase (short-subunit alcohol dehydrogenase family)